MEMVNPYGIPAFYDRVEITTKPSLSAFNIATSGASGTDSRTINTGWVSITGTSVQPGDVVTPKALDADNNTAYHFARLAIVAGAGEGYVPVTSTTLSYKVEFRNADTGVACATWTDAVTTLSTHNISNDTQEHPYASGSPQENTTVTLDLRTGGGMGVNFNADNIDAMKITLTISTEWGTPVRYDHKFVDNGGSVGKCIEFNHASDSYTPSIRWTFQTLDNLYIHRFGQRSD